jgi:hypothetical protein
MILNRSILDEIVAVTSMRVDPRTGYYWGAEDRWISGSVASY